MRWPVGTVVATAWGSALGGASPTSSAVALLPSPRLYSAQWEEAAPAWMGDSTAAHAARLLHGALSEAAGGAPACAVAGKPGAGTGGRRFRLCVGGRLRPPLQCAEEGGGAAAARLLEGAAAAWSEDASTADSGGAAAAAAAWGKCAGRARRGGGGGVRRPRARCARAPVLLGRHNATRDAAALRGGAAAQGVRWRRLDGGSVGSTASGGGGGSGGGGALVIAAAQYFTGGDECDAAGASGRQRIARLLYHCGGGGTGDEAFAVRLSARELSAAAAGARHAAWSLGCCQCQHTFLVANYRALCTAPALGALRERQQLVQGADAALAAAFTELQQQQQQQQQQHRDASGSGLWASHSAESQRMARAHRELTYGEITTEGALNMLDRLPAQHALGSSSVLFDVGSGEGRFTMLAAMVFGVRRAVGIEIVEARHAVGGAARQRLLQRLRGGGGGGGGALAGGALRELLLARAGQTELRLGDALAPSAFAEATHVYAANLLFGEALNQRLAAALAHAPALHCVATLKELPSQSLPSGWALAGEMLAEMSWSSDSDVFLYLKQPRVPPRAP